MPRIFYRLTEARASKQAVSATQKEGKSCIEGAKYAVSKYLPPPSKMRSLTFHCRDPWLAKIFLDFYGKPAEKHQSNQLRIPRNKQAMISLQGMAYVKFILI